MTMRLSLVIQGEDRGGKRVVKEAAAELDQLAAKAKSTGTAITQSVGSATEKVAKGVGDATKLSAQQLSQLQFQLQDMAVGLTSGQSPFTVMMQQGSQMAQMFTSGTGVAGALKSVGQGIAQFLTNPLNLAVLAAGVATTALVKVAEAVTANWPAAESVIARHESLVKRVGEHWDKNLLRIKAYSEESRALFLFEATQLESQLGQARRASLTELSTPRALLGGQALGTSRAAIAQTGNFELLGAFNSLIEGLKKGTPDIARFRDQIALIGATANDPAVTRLVQQLLDQTAAAAEAERAWKQNQDVIKGLTGDSSAMNKAMGEARSGAEGLTGSLKGLAKGMGEAFAASQRGFDPFGLEAKPSALLGIKGDRAFLDLLGLAEGTDRGRGYNETLGYGRFSGGNRELVTMTLREILALQKQMLAHPENSFNSSALGRHQLTRETLLDFMPRLGLSLDAVFTPELQDKIALAIANSTGGNVGALRGRWQGLNNINAGIITSAFNSSQGLRAGAAQDMSSAQMRAAEKATREYEQAIARAAKQDESWSTFIAKRSAELVLNARMIGKTADEQARLRHEEQLWAEARSTYGERLKQDPALHDAVAQAIRRQTDEFMRQRAELEKTAQVKRIGEAEWSRKIAMQNYEYEKQVTLLDKIRGLGRGILSTFTQTFQQTGSLTKSFGAVLDSVLEKATARLDDFISKLLFGAEGSDDGGLLGGFLGNLFGSLFNGSNTSSLYAKGGVFAASLAAFASGGAFTNSVVSEPTFFRYGGSRLGIMGEAGPEAIMPLTGANQVRAAIGGRETALPLQRMSDGSLGVSLDGSFGRRFAKGDVITGTSGGSALTGGVTINHTVRNYEGVKVENRSRRNSDGSIDIDTAIGSAMTRMVAQGRLDGALEGRFDGIRRKTERRG